MQIHSWLLLVAILPACGGSNEPIDDPVEQSNQKADLCQEDSSSCKRPANVDELQRCADACLEFYSACTVSCRESLPSKMDNSDYTILCYDDCQDNAMDGGGEGCHDLLLRAGRDNCMFQLL
jgi:hypothetical protein